jgi:hypothetical protein
MFALLLAACTSSSYDVLDETFTAENGLSANVAIVVPENTDSTRPLGALLYFSADFDNSEYVDQAELHAEVAAEHNLVLASMASPSAGDDSGCWWAPQGEDNTDYADEFLQERLIGELGASADRVFTTGLSGGAGFASSFHFFTDYQYSGGAVMLCGGDVPRLNGGGCEPQEDPEAAPAPTDLTAEVLSQVRYDFAITSDDFLLAYTEAGASFYEELGFSDVQHRIVDGSGHCGFDSGWEGLDVFAEGMDYVDP